MNRCPLATDLVEWIDAGERPTHPVAAHVATCRSCQRSVMNVRASAPSADCQRCGHPYAEHHENPPEGCPWPPDGYEILFNGEAVPILWPDG